VNANRSVPHFYSHASLALYTFPQAPHRGLNRNPALESCYRRFCCSAFAPTPPFSLYRLLLCCAQITGSRRLNLGMISFTLEMGAGACPARCRTCFSKRFAAILVDILRLLIEKRSRNLVRGLRIIFDYCLARISSTSVFKYMKTDAAEPNAAAATAASEPPHPAHWDQMTRKQR